tara:strand:- start:1139 stop:1330 length:192 start_codon:yes stop_codon:yes gene_type:complete
MQPGFYIVEKYYASTDDWAYVAGFKDEAKAFEYAETNLYKHFVRITRDGEQICQALPLDLRAV